MNLLGITLTIIAILLMYLLYTIIIGNNKKTGSKRRNLYTKGLNHMLQGENEAAIVSFKKYVKNNSDDIDAYIKLGSMLRESGKPDSSVKIFNTLLYRQTISKEHKIAILINLAKNYIKLDKKQQSLKVIKDLLQLDKKNFWALETIWKLYRDTEQWENAAEYLKKVSPHKSENDRRLLALYKIQEGLEKFEIESYHEARLIFKKALKIDRKCEAAHYYIAQSYINSGREKDAIPWWEKFVEAAPGKANIIFSSIQELFFGLGKFEEIDTFYKRILKKKPTDLDTVIELAEYYNMKGKSDRAIAFMEELIEKNPNSVRAKVALCKYLLTKGKNLRAKDMLKQTMTDLRKHDLNVCSNCGHREEKVVWLCPVCGENDTYF